MGNRSMFVGMDVHKETIDVSIAEGARDGEVRHYGVIASDLEPLDKVVRALRAPDRRLHFVYEAGPCGFGIHRHLTARGEECVVVSPSMIPKRSGDRVKTDRRDSQMLARLDRPGEFARIYIPDAADEAMRELVRAREDAVVVGTQAKYRLKAFLLRQGRRYPGREGWTLPYRRWLTDLSFPSELMAYLGLVPSEYSSGPSVRRGAITKAGNPHVRRLLAEAAWAYQGIPRIGRQHAYRQEALPKVVCDIAWKAQLRLTTRFKRLIARGKAKPKVATAIARELSGFIWAIAREVSPTPR